MSVRSWFAILCPGPVLPVAGFWRVDGTDEREGRPNGRRRCDVPARLCARGGVAAAVRAAGAGLRSGLRNVGLRHRQPAGRAGGRADDRRRVYVTAAVDGTSRLVGPADPTAATAPSAAFRVILRDHDLIRIDAD